jgi:hypothetical protein
MQVSMCLVAYIDALIVPSPYWRPFDSLIAKIAEAHDFNLRELQQLQISLNFQEKKLQKINIFCLGKSIFSLPINSL